MCSTTADCVESTSVSFLIASMFKILKPKLSSHSPPDLTCDGAIPNPIGLDRGILAGTCIASGTTPVATGGDCGGASQVCYSGSEYSFLGVHRAKLTSAPSRGSMLVVQVPSS